MAIVVLMQWTYSTFASSHPLRQIITFAGALEPRRCHEDFQSSVERGEFQFLLWCPRLNLCILIHTYQTGKKEKQDPAHITVSSVVSTRSLCAP